ncbi:hydrogenase maturation nickel metallochaperone HypA [Desulforhopalus singaporensis]|uniref:Hydrogenase maturation factor HypA n=1 Tax=Desulforhopalus singaporensis TaxID=91360 RepID=A0A1H0T1V8_9BACT|nr:hydrogenase maturation nickel metallochaperone HypA [Desulforhopalus singaporensis]SDP47566.1 hydrogenase nickel incorporation protein HypA/HybF [Desulforhopalus singaporensis]
MHELQVTKRILDIALKHAQASRVNKVLAIQLRIGAMSDLEDQWIQKYFDHLSKNTLAENARLKIERAPAVMKCNDCGHSFEVSIKEIDKIQCPECAHASSLTFISGREYYIKNLEAI